MVGILYVLFGRVLGPLTALAGGLSDLKRHSYDVRMPSPQARELAAITDHFNALAGALADRARGEPARSIGSSSLRRTTNGGARRSNCTTRSGPVCSG